MEMREPNWDKINLCLDYLLLLDRKIDTYEHDQKIKCDLDLFYNVVFNLAYYEFALAYTEVMNESNEIIKEHLKKYMDKHKEDKNGGFDGGFNL